MQLPAKRIVRAVIPRPIRNWLRSPTSSMRWMYDDLRHRMRCHVQVELRPGFRFWSHPSAARVLWNQTTDPAQVKEFDSFIGTCRPGMVLFDIGCHFGIFSMAALHYGGYSARSVAVDPSPAAIAIARAQFELNQSSGRCTVVCAAAGEQNGWTQMIPVGVLAAGYFTRTDGNHPATELVQVRQISLDSLANEIAVTPTHIKIDVEGNEAAVLKGAKQLLNSASPQIFLELHNEIIRARGEDPQDTIDILLDAGYTLRPIGDCGGCGPAELLSKEVVRLTAARERNEIEQDRSAVSSRF